MKKFLSLVIAVSVICSALPAYAYSQSDYHSKASELRTLINQCKELGINTQYEEIDANIIDTYADRIATFEDAGISSSITNYQLSELNSLYTNAKANLQGYLNETKQAPQEVYSYVTGDNYELDGKSLKAVNGAPYYSIGFGHFGNWLYPNMAEFKSYGYDNVQAIVGLSGAIGADRVVDSWDTSISGNADVYFDADPGEGHSNGTSINIINDSPAASNVYGRMFQRLAVKPNTNYILSFYAKGTADSNGLTYNVNGGYSGYTAVSGLKENEWKKITAGFKTGPNEFFKDFTFLFQNVCDVYIDDINIHKSGDSRNIVKNGGFDGDGYDDFDIIFENNGTVNSLLRTLYAAEQNNIHAEVLLQLQQEMPTVITSKYPSLQVDGRYNVDANISKQVEQAYIETILDLISDYNSVTSIILVNEPNYNTSKFTDQYNDAFKAYSPTYGASGMPTTFEATQRFYDWKNFNDSVFVDWYERTVEIIKNRMPDMPVSLKAQPDFEAYDRYSSSLNCDIRWEHMGRGANMELIDEFSDFHGNDASASFEEYAYLKGVALKWYDYLNSISNKPIYNSENHITKNTDEYSANINKFVTNNIWQSAIHGLDMSSIWTWNPENTDSNSSTYGHLAMRPSAISDVAKTNLDLNRVASKVALIANAQPDVAILRSDASRIYTSNYIHTLTRAYEAALESGHKVGFVTKNNIADKLSSYSTLIIPNATNVEENIINAIYTFDGRVIILGDNSLLKNQYDTTYTGSALTKINAIKNRATKLSVTANGTYQISAPTIASIASTLIADRAVTVTNSNGTATSDVEWQYVPYSNGYLINVNNYSTTDTKNVQVKISGNKVSHLVSVLDGTDAEGNLSLGAMTGGLYYASNTDSEVEADSWSEVVRMPQLLDTNDITVLNGTRNGNVNTLTWRAQSYGKYNVYEVKADGSLEFIASTYDETFEDTATGAKTYVVKGVTSTGESNGKAITLGFNMSGITDNVVNSEGSSTFSVDYENTNAFAVAVTFVITAENADDSFAGAAIVEKIIPAGGDISYSKEFKTIGTGSLTVTKK